MQIKDLEKLIAETVVKNMELNPNYFSSDIIKDSIPLQISVASTIQILEKLGLVHFSED